MTTFTVPPTLNESETQAARASRAADRANVGEANSVPELRAIVKNLLTRVDRLEDELQHARGGRDVASAKEKPKNAPIK